jgi:hypothetical protein
VSPLKTDWRDIFATITAGLPLPTCKNWLCSELPTLHRMLGADFESWQRRGIWRLWISDIMRITGSCDKLEAQPRPGKGGHRTRHRVALANEGQCQCYNVAPLAAVKLRCRAITFEGVGFVR